MFTQIGSRLENARRLREIKFSESHESYGQRPNNLNLIRRGQREKAEKKQWEKALEEHKEALEKREKEAKAERPQKEDKEDKTLPTSPATTDKTLPTSPATRGKTLPTSPATTDKTLPTSPATTDKTLPTILAPTGKIQSLLKLIGNLPDPKKLFPGLDDFIEDSKKTVGDFGEETINTVGDFGKDQLDSVVKWGDGAIEEAKEGISDALDGETMSSLKQIGDWLKWIFLGGLRKWFVKNAIYFYVGGGIFLVLFIFLVIRKISRTSGKMSAAFTKLKEVKRS
jgi:hypothetical protein